MALASHLFVNTGEGALWDTRAPDWHKGAPVRSPYRAHGAGPLRTLGAVKAALRAGAFTDLGAYPLYFTTADGGALTFESVRQNWREIVAAYAARDRSCGWYVVEVAINWEDSDLVCDHSGAAIPSAYGEA